MAGAGEARGTSAASAVANAPTRRCPAVPACTAVTSRRARASRSRIAVACSRRQAPSAVRATPRGSRSNSRAPTSSSKAAIWRDTADCV